MRLLHSITDSMDMSLRKFQEIVYVLILSAALFPLHAPSSPHPAHRPSCLFPRVSCRPALESSNGLSAGSSWWIAASSTTKVSLSLVLAGDAESQCPLFIILPCHGALNLMHVGA